MGFTFDFHISDGSDSEREEEYFREKSSETAGELEKAGLEHATGGNTQPPCLPQPVRIAVDRENIRNLYEWEVLNLESSKMGGTKGKIYKRTMEDIKVQLAMEDEQDLFNNPSDIIPFVYEGGLKTWECAIDLACFLFEHDQLVRDKKVLELGCGSGLPGIAALATNAATTGAKANTVIFQDYNAPVLKMTTIPNVLLNTSLCPSLACLDSSNNDLPLPNQQYGDQEVDTDDHELMNRAIGAIDNVAFYAGPWSQDMANLILQNHGKQDLILTSETIYNEETVAHLLQLVKSVLKPDGICLVAAKLIYFGCSGSVESFVACARSKQFGFEVQEVFTHTEGVKRQIISLTLPCDRIAIEE